MKESLENIVALSDIRRERSRALSPYGPVRAGLTTLPDQEIERDDPLVQLMELLSSLESVVQDLNYKSFTAYDTLNTATENLRGATENLRRAERSDTLTGEGGTDD
jgi:hypothetical protein